MSSGIRFLSLLCASITTCLSTTLLQGDVPAKRIAYIHGDIAADGTTPSGAAAPYDQMLLDDTGSTGLSVFRNMVEAEGYDIEQFYDRNITLNTNFLNDFDAILFGLHQKIWSAAEKTALDSWLRNGGGMLAYSDSAAGGAYNVVGIKNTTGQNVFNNLIADYGLQVTVDQGGGTRAYTADADATHPIVTGPLVLEGEGVSIIAIDPTNTTAQILIPFNTANRVSGNNLNIDPQGVSIANPLWASLALQSVGDGHVVAMFDRQPMWNSGPGSDITKRDNTELLRRIVRFLVGDSTVPPPSDSTPVFTVHPGDRTVAYGGTTTLSATVTGSPAPDLQWLRDGQEIPGAESATLVIANASGSEVAAYSLVATNTLGSVTSDSANLTVLPPAIGSIIPSNNLVAEWLFDETEGLSALDTTGFNRHGTLVNASRIAGKLNGGVAFNGSTSSVQIDPFDISGSALSISLWMRHDGSFSEDARLISKASSTDPAENYWKIGPHDNQSLRTRVRAGGTTHELHTANDVFTLGQWHHITMIYDGSTLALHVDGNSVGSTAASGTLDSAPAVGVALGDQPTGTGSRPFEGALDLVRIYSRALNSEEIAALSNEADAPAMSGFPAWIELLETPPPGQLAGPLDDPDNDNIVNLLEYALGGLPMDSNSAPQPQLIKDPGGYAFHYRKNAPDLTYTVELNTTLAPDDWSPLLTPENYNPNTGLHYRIQPANSETLFFRLRVSDD